MKFWNIKKTQDQIGEITIYGEIAATQWFGDEMTPQQFRAELDALGEIGELNLYINSPGGDVFAAEAIYNMICRIPAIKRGYVDGLAASAASFLLMACDEIIMPENAVMMIHEAWTTTAGNKRELAKTIDRLTMIDGILAKAYAKKCGKSEEEVLKMMEAETWMTATQAKEAGFDVKIEQSTPIAACMTEKIATRYRNLPEGIGIICETMGTPCNGEEIQPVEDRKPETGEYNALDAQKKRFFEARKRIIEMMED